MELILNLERTRFSSKARRAAPKKVGAALLWDFFSRGAGLATPGQQQQQEPEEQDKRPTHQKSKGTKGLKGEDKK